MEAKVKVEVAMEWRWLVSRATPIPESTGIVTCSCSSQVLVVPSLGLSILSERC